MYYNYRIDNRVRGTSCHIVYISYKKRLHSASPGGVVLGLPSPSPRVCTDGQMDGRTYADVRTKIFPINGLPNLLTHGAPRAPLLDGHLSYDTLCYKVRFKGYGAHDDMWLPSSFACKRNHNLDPENVIEVKKKTKSSKKSELKERKPKVGSSCTVKNYRKPSNIA